MRTHDDVTRAGARADETCDALNSLLRGELSAVETYDQAIKKLGGTSCAQQLQECRRSHSERVEMLRQRIVQVGGEPSDGSGPWGAFAKLVEGGAKVFGEKAAIAALEEGEDHGLKQYRRDMEKLDASTRAMVEQSLWPEQERTHRVLSSLKHSLH
jgi:uncharacterized protein (TIGR02284 family)